MQAFGRDRRPSDEGHAVNTEQAAKVQEAADRVMELGEEVEAPGHAVDDDALERARAALHKWVDAAQRVVVNPALGRVTLIHGDGRISTITSADLPFAMSA
jgi:hypothetical protein